MKRPTYLPLWWNAYTHDSDSCDRKVVQVQILPGAPSSDGVAQSEQRGRTPKDVGITPTARPFRSVVELADTVGSNPAAVKRMGVRLPPDRPVLESSLTVGRTVLTCHP